MKLSQDIKAIFSSESDNAMKFGDFLERINHKSFGVFLAILALPSALPVPAPGYSTPFGLLLVFLGFQILVNRKYIWFPKFITEKPLPLLAGSKLLSGMVSFLEFFERFLKPRVKILTKGIFYRIVGLLVVLCGSSMILPIPLTNTAPAFGIFLMGIGLLEEDGLVIILGMISCLLGILLSVTLIYFLIFFGWAGVNYVIDTIRSVV
jgi:hypothetical protein